MSKTPLIAVDGRWIIAMWVLIELVTCRGAIGELTSDQRHDLFNEAQQAYDRGINLLASDPVAARAAFSDASSRLQLLVDSGKPNGALLYNLANACFQAGDNGRAILNYRRAEKLLPGDTRVQNNLHYARSQCQTQIERGGRESLIRALLVWHFSWPVAWRFEAFAAVNALLWLAMAWMLLRPGAMVRWLGGVLALAWLALGASLMADLTHKRLVVEGILINNDVVVRKGNGVGYQPEFDQPLHAGVEFQVLEQRGDWLNIRLRNGRDGWIESQAAAMID